MKYEQAKHLKPAEFKLFWGVKLETFKQMVEIVSQHEGQKRLRFNLIAGLYNYELRISPAKEINKIYK